MRSKRVLVALAVAGATFGVATAVQASIPDASGIVHACYTANNLQGYPPGALRAIDTAKINGRCSQNEAPVDLATPQYVQNVVTSTINQTSFMIIASGQIPGPNEIIGNFFCGAGYVATDFATGATDNTFASNALFSVHSFYNEGEVLNGTPNEFGHIFFHISASAGVTIHGTCVDGRVFGLPGPAAPVKLAKSQARVTLRPAS
jgi:hypothetical protein